jgi:hypothetical protein
MAAANFYYKWVAYKRKMFKHIQEARRPGPKFREPN